MHGQPVYTGIFYKNMVTWEEHHSGVRRKYNSAKTVSHSGLNCGEKNAIEHEVAVGMTQYTFSAVGGGVDEQHCQRNSE